MWSLNSLCTNFHQKSSTLPVNFPVLFSSSVFSVIVILQLRFVQCLYYWSSLQTSPWTLRGFSVSWYPASTSCVHFAPLCTWPPAPIIAAEFPRTLMENFSSCSNKSSPSRRDHWPALIERWLDLTVMFGSAALGSVLLSLFSTVWTECWWCKNSC